MKIRRLISTFSIFRMSVKPRPGSAGAPVKIDYEFPSWCGKPPQGTHLDRVPNRFFKVFFSGNSDLFLNFRKFFKAFGFFKGFLPFT